MKTFYKPSGNTYYCRFIEHSTGDVWNNSLGATEGADEVSWAASAVAVTEVSGTGQYPITVPTDLPVNEMYDVILYQQSGDSPAYSDLIDDSYSLRNDSNDNLIN